MRKTKLTYLPLVLLGVSLAALYLGERALAGMARLVLSGLGGALFVAAVVAAFLRWRTADSQRRAALRTLLVEYAVITLGLVAYLAQADVLAWVEPGKLQTALQVGWVGLVALGALPAVASELALIGMARAPQIESWRLRLAARAARIVAFALIAFAGVNYASAQWNRKIDLSYFKTTQAGSSTKAVVQGLTTPVRFVLFFPPGNDVAEAARAYFEELAATNALAAVEWVDQALDPELARKLRVRANGYVVIAAGEKVETLHLGVELESAARQLKKLDGEVHKKLLAVVRPPRVAYFTSGHQERDYAPSGEEKRAALRDFRTLLEVVGFSVKRLGLAEGLGSEIPKDASLVVVAGPVDPFLPEERAALGRYLDKGGRLLALIDPDFGGAQDDLLAPLGVKVSKALLANDDPRYRIGNAPTYLGTNRFGNHPSVVTMTKLGGRYGLGLIGAGAVSKIDKGPAGITITGTLRTMPDTWLDLDGNGRFDKATEKREQLDFAATVERAGKTDAADETTGAMRALVIGDADIAGDQVLRNQGNYMFLGDGLRWLVGDEDTAGTVESEEDNPIVQREDEDKRVFYLTSAVIPFGVLGLGLWGTRRAARPKKDRT